MGNTEDAVELLLLDLGNTNLKIGFANRERLLASHALPIPVKQTVDSLGLQLDALFRQARIEARQFVCCVYVSVVPSLDGLIRETVKVYAGCPIVAVPDDLSVPLDNGYKRPEELGADRLLAAWSARKHCPDAQGLIIVDYGTAVTFDCVSQNRFLGGLIFPGPGLAMTALAQNTARLGLTDLQIGNSELLPGDSTESGIRNGLLFGYLAMTEGILARLRPIVPKPVKVVGTGLFAATLEQLGRPFDMLMPNLVLEGGRRLFYRCGQTPPRRHIC